MEQTFPLNPTLRTKTIAFIGAPFCEGQNLDGTDLAPVALREANLFTAWRMLGWKVLDKGDLDFANLFEQLNLISNSHAHKHDSVALYRQWINDNNGSSENFSTWVRRHKHLDAGKMRRTVSHHDHQQQVKEARERSSSGGAQPEVINAALMGAGVGLVHQAVKKAAMDGHFAFTCGGDHSIAAGTISALLSQHPNLCVVWVDAHADANTPRTSPSMHYHGMPAAHLMGWFEEELAGFEWLKAGCLDEARLAYIGLRDVDEAEASMLRNSHVHTYTMRDVDKYGIAKVIEMALQAIDPNGRCPMHLSLDIDAVDPHYAPGTGTAARGGLTYREIHYICEEMAETGRLVGMDLVEVNPGLDPAPSGEKMHGDNAHVNERLTPTVQLAVELSLSALGKSIL